MPQMTTNALPEVLIEDPVPRRERTIDAWFRDLKDGRVEIMCKASDLYRLRVTAPENEAWEAVEMFERLVAA